MRVNLRTTLSINMSVSGEWKKVTRSLVYCGAVFDSLWEKWGIFANQWEDLCFESLVRKIRGKRLRKSNKGEGDKAKKINLSKGIIIFLYHFSLGSSFSRSPQFQKNVNYLIKNQLRFLLFFSLIFPSSNIRFLQWEINISISIPSKSFNIN